MDGERYRCACSYLTKRPRLSSQNSQPNTFNSSSMSGDSNESDDMDRDGMIVGCVANEPSDEELLSWQERQIAKCIHDNTVNRVVESYLTFFEDEDANAPPGLGSDAFPDMQEPIRIFVPDDFEDAAILRAIDEHGLQQHNNESNGNVAPATAEHSAATSRSSTPSSISSVPGPFPDFLDSTSEHTTDASDDESAIKLPLSSHDTQLPSDRTNVDVADAGVNSDDEPDETRMDKRTVIQNECHEEIPPTRADEDALSSDDDDDDEDDDRIASTQVANVPRTTSSSIAVASTSADETADNSEHFDFMEAAVAVAIQKKGLAPYSIQSSPKR